MTLYGLAGVPKEHERCNETVNKAITLFLYSIYMHKRNKAFLWIPSTAVEVSLFEQKKCAYFQTRLKKNHYRI